MLRGEHEYGQGWFRSCCLSPAWSQAFQALERWEAPSGWVNILILPNSHLVSEDLDFGENAWCQSVSYSFPPYDRKAKLCNHGRFSVKSPLWKVIPRTGWTVLYLTSLCSLRTRHNPVNNLACHVLLWMLLENESESEVLYMEIAFLDVFQDHLSGSQEATSLLTFGTSKSEICCRFSRFCSCRHW